MPWKGALDYPSDEGTWIFGEPCYLHSAPFVLLCPHVFLDVQRFVLGGMDSFGLRMKITSIIARGNPQPDPDCPQDPLSTRYWCTVGGSMSERESTTLTGSTQFAVQTSEANMMGLMGGTPGIVSQPTQLALTNGEPSGGDAPMPSMTNLMEVAQQVSAGHMPAGQTVVAKAKAKTKAKAKAKVESQKPKTYDEQRAALRIMTEYYLEIPYLFWYHKFMSIYSFDFILFLSTCFEVQR